MSDSVRPYGLQPARLHGAWDSQARILEWVAVPSSRDLFDPGMEPESNLHWQVGPLPLAPPGKPSSVNLNQKKARVMRDPGVNLSGEEIPHAHAQ